MITEHTTRADALREAAQAVVILGNLGFIAGGYARDIYYGQVPKDMDVWVNLPEGATYGMLLAKAQRIAERFGQTVDEDASLANWTAYGQQRVCFKVIQGDSLFQKLDIIFDPRFTGRNRQSFLDTFDLEICKIGFRMDGTVVTPVGWGGRIGYNQREEYTQAKHLEINPYRWAQRILHLREKYPLLHTQVAHDLMNDELANVLNIFRELGVLNDPRQILQAEAPEFEGNQVRLNVGANPVRDAWIVNPWGVGNPGPFGGVQRG